jgi:hypothetical protein
MAASGQPVAGASRCAIGARYSSHSAKYVGRLCATVEAGPVEDLLGEPVVTRRMALCVAARRNLRHVEARLSLHDSSGSSRDADSSVSRRRRSSGAGESQVRGAEHRQPRSLKHTRRVRRFGRGASRFFEAQMTSLS